MGSSVAPSVASPPAGASGSTDAGLPIGAVLDGRYELTGRIADGGGGTVYEGRDQVLRRRVAVKVRRESDLDHGDRFEQEARLMAGLCHPGLVTVFDAGTDLEVSSTPQAYLVLEYVDGRTLADRLADGPLTSDETARLGAQLAGALAYVHSRGIVHRDVKPANVLLRTSPDDELPVAKLTDFGVARLIDGHGMTAHGQTVGTANYLSPEQAVGADCGPETDIYALGLLLLECLTGATVFPGSGIAAAAARLHHPVPIPMSVEPAWGDLIAAMTASDPAQRPAATHVATRLARMSGPLVRAEATVPLAAGLEAGVAAGLTPGAAIDAAADGTAQETRAGGATAVLAPILVSGRGRTARAANPRRRRWALAGLPGAAAAGAAIWLALASGPSASSGVPSTVAPSPKAAAATTQPVVVHSPASQRQQPAQQQPKPAKAHHGHGGGDNSDG